MIRGFIMAACLAGAAGAQGVSSDQTETTTTSQSTSKPVSFGGMTGTETRETSTTQTTSGASTSSAGISLAQSRSSGSSVANQARREREEQQQNDGDALSEIFGTLFGAPPQPQQPQAGDAQTWRYAVSRYRGPIVCYVTLHDDQLPGGNGRYATPDSNCPREWLGVRSYNLDGRSGYLNLNDGGANAFWSGRSVGDQRYQGRARDGQTYELVYSQAAVTGNDTPDWQGNRRDRRHNYKFEPDALYGDWTMSQAGKWGGCKVKFPKPDPDATFGKPNAVDAQAGCPGQVMFATQWFVTGGELKLADNFNKVKASLRQTGRNSWEGKTDRDEAIEMRR